jgi:hypothetical protein
MMRTDDRAGINQRRRCEVEQSDTSIRRAKTPAGSVLSVVPACHVSG